MVLRAKYRGFDVSCDTEQELETIKKAGALVVAGHGGRRTEPNSTGRLNQRRKRKYTWDVVKALHAALANAGVNMLERQLTVMVVHSLYSDAKRKYEQLHEHRARRGRPLSEAEIESGAYLMLYRKFVPGGTPNPPCPRRPNF